MKFFDAEKKEFVAFGDDFVKQYAAAYYYPEDDVKNGEKEPTLIKGLNRSSRYPEEEIERLLRDGIKNEEDVVHILAWKIGGIDHIKCTKEEPFVYVSGWSNLKDYNQWSSNVLTVKLYGHQLPIKEIATYVLENLDCWEEKVAQDDWFDVVKDLDEAKKEKSWQEVGATYFISLLYFISKGKYPIFDQFADKAVAAIQGEEEKFPNQDKKEYRMLPSDLPKKEEALKRFQDRYNKYCEGIETLKGQLSAVYHDPQNRDLDRALWVYGHLACADDLEK